MLVNEKKIDKKAIGSRIKHIRIKNGHTLKSFGELFEADKANVHRWELGLQLPNKQRIFLISRYAGITVDDLLYGSDGYMQKVYVLASRLSEKDRLKLVKKVMESVIDED